MGLGVDMVVSMFLLTCASLVEWVLDHHECIWNLTVDYGSESGYIIYWN